MFDELSPQDFAFKARDVMNKNLLLTGEQRYSADYYAMQRIHKYLKSTASDSNLHTAAARMILKVLMKLTPYSERTAQQLQVVADECYECFNKIIMDYIENLMKESEVPLYMSTTLLRIFRCFGRQRMKFDENNTESSKEASFDEEDADEFDSNEYAIPVAQMSMSLRRALGLNNIGDEDDIYKKMAAKSDWRAPEKYGLSNSSAVFVTPPRSNNHEPRCDQRNEKFNKAPKTSRTEQYEHCALDEDDDDDDDESDYDFDDNDDGEVPSGAMSVNLMKALGMDTTGMEVETDWKPPERSGLEHSKPIFENPTRPSTGNKSRMTSPRADQNYSTNRSERTEDASYDNEDDDDDESDYDFDDNDDGEVPRGAMSLSLMKALGMDTTGMEVETDWKPPERSGLEHSKPIFYNNPPSLPRSSAHRPKTHNFSEAPHIT